MRLHNIIASGAILVGLMLTPAPVAAQSFSFSFGGDGPRYHDHYPRYRHHYPRYHRDYRPRYRPRARIHVDLGPFSITAGGRLGHIARCEARFRSYDRRSEAYMGYDGERHRCRL